MEEKDYTGIIPEQEDGKEISVKSEVETGDLQKAKALFDLAKNRLLDVNHWQELTGKLLADFQLTDHTGQHVEGLVREGLYYKIDIPGPGSSAGAGYDWTKVEKIDIYSSTDVDSIGIRVRPTSNPSSGDESIAHFYDKDSTSTFTLTRENTKVTAAIYDRNTKTNQDTEKLTDKVRNTAIGGAGIVSFSKIQWKSLTDGLLKQAD